VGAKKFEPDNPIFDKIRTIGEEFGATTGRPRQCNWMDWNLIRKAIKINGVTDLIINKTDVLDKVGEWALYRGESELLAFSDSNEMQSWIEVNSNDLPTINKVIFSGKKEEI